MSKYFIEHPVLANVLAIVLVLLGAVSLFRLPISEYPNVVPPTVQVTASYPGASPQTVIDQVALPIELQVNGVDRMLYMQSTSCADGTYTLTVTFEIGTDPDIDQVLVQNRVQLALASLPQPVQAQGVNVQKKSTSILQIVNLHSADDRFTGLFLSNYATINLTNILARIPGVGQVGMPPAPSTAGFQYTVDIQSRLDEPEQFANIIVKDRTKEGGELVLVKDIGRVELGAQTYSEDYHFDGRPAAGIAIYQTPEANALQVGDAVRAKMAELAKRFPDGMRWGIPYDTTLFVTASINEVYTTLYQAGILVLIVILVFLQNFRATAVPATTVPVTIIGAFAGMAALGFSVNLSTLFGIVLAIGIVVDDAIVIVEGVTKHIEGGLSRHDAAIKAMAELFGPIIGITLVLMSVFLPAAFVPGLTGQMFAQFALVIAATALISAVNAATLKPTQCAQWLRTPVPLEKRNFFYRGFNRVYDRMEAGYTRFIGFTVRNAVYTIALGLVLAGVAGWGIARLPTAFIPIDDQGYLIAAVQLPDGASLNRTTASLQQVHEQVKDIPGV